MHIDTHVTTPINRSFRVDQVAGMFDVALGESSGESFAVEVPDLSEAWTIGLIVGPSGSGKSTVARQAFGDGVVDAVDWPADRSVLDGFDAALDGRTITAMLSAVGFSSPPAWVRPHRVLSGGQRFRCDLARALLLDRELVVFDEFTSVVDRTVAKVGSACVAKAVRAGHARCRRFIAVTCHYDVAEWLEPDWVLDMADGVLARGRLQRRPALSMQVCPCHKRLWRLFQGHHYLSGELHPGSRCYAAVIDGSPVGFCATLPSMGHRGLRRVHRLVVLPDWQGIGVGGRLLDAVAERESATHGVSIRTGHPALIRRLEKSPRWRVTSVSKGTRARQNGWLAQKAVKPVGSEGRVTVSFRWKAV